ncbi:MAG: transporter substrate-binding domain-containing protein [Marinilabiliaceae bacterium]|nr:transporter substrate-binding domain-containing protein [Marinilabiliaceae bacterium]
MNARFFGWAAICLLTFLIQACHSGSTGNENNTSGLIDLPEMKQQGTLRVVIDYNSTNYFIYKGQPMGYQLELLQELGNYLSLKLDVTVCNDMGQNFESLEQGNVDVIATNIAVTKEMKPDISFTEPHSYTRQVLVQRKYNREEEANRVKTFNAIIRNQLDLAGKTIYVQRNSSYAHRLRSLSNEIADSINVVEIPDYEAEQLIGLVAAGEIDYTVCDENLARVNKNYYPNIDIETAISFPQKIAWAVRTSSPELLKAINQWMVGFKKTARYEKIFQKYFLNRRSMQMVENGTLLLRNGQVSVYDEIIKAESKKMNWDWRLIASLIYQESRFSSTSVSWAGAQGLMQLMPQTAETFGVHDVNSPSENIRGGLKLLEWLDKRMATRIENPKERLKFVLAAYNVGIGHVLDAMSLAEKNGKNPKIWENNVDFYLLNKSNPEYFNDPVVKFGYCRGAEPYKYVIEVLERYEHYKILIR